MYLEAEKQMKMFKSCLTTQEIFSQQKNACQGLTYRRIPIPDFCAPKEKVPRGWDGAAASFPSRASCCGVNVTWVLGATQPQEYGAVPRLSVGSLPEGPPGDAVWRLWVSSAGWGWRMLGWIRRVQRGARDFSVEAAGQGGILWWGREVGCTHKNPSALLPAGL